MDQSEIIEVLEWHERLALLNAGVPEIRTSMDEPGYWEERLLDFQMGRDK
jgi:hypothetical protein